MLRPSRTVPISRIASADLMRGFVDEDESPRVATIEDEKEVEGPNVIVLVVKKSVSDRVNFSPVGKDESQFQTSTRRNC